MKYVSTSQRGYILALIKEKFGNLALWMRIESEIAVKCASLPEVITEERRIEFVAGLKDLHQFITEQGIPQSDMRFLDEEIERYENTRQVTLYQEEDYNLDDVTVLAYAAQANGTEGITAIHLGLNYTQLGKLTNGVYKETKLVKFYISKERTIYGKIVAEVYENPVKIAVAHLCEIKTGGDDVKTKRIFLFGEKIDPTKWNVMRQIKSPFRVYRFNTEFNEELVVLSTEKLEIGDYVISGVIKEVDDYRILTETAKLPTKLPYFFSQNARSRIIKYETEDEFRAALGRLNVKRDTIFNYPFTIKKQGRQIIPKHPEWFKWLIWAWLTHQPKGLCNKYPLHILMAGPKASGKSLLLNALHSRSKESRDIFSGSSSTLKNLVPSFRSQPAKIGYLAESNRFAFCDEFLRCLVRTRNEDSGRDESVAMMNDLLEHQKREAGSGNSRVNVNMTARVFAATNPVRGINNVEDMTRLLDESFLCRWIIYYQGETGQHVRMIRASVDEDLQSLEYKLEDAEWIGLLDYLQSISARYDMHVVEKILEEPKMILSENLLRHYDARHRHHIECLIDGIVKTRCMVEHDMAFKANNEDYELLRNVWLAIVHSWNGVNNLKLLQIDDRIHHVPESAQFLYWRIVDEKKPVSMMRSKELALKGMTANEYITAYMVLRDNELIFEGDDGFIRPHYMEHSEAIDDVRHV